MGESADAERVAALLACGHDQSHPVRPRRSGLNRAVRDQHPLHCFYVVSTATMLVWFLRYGVQGWANNRQEA
jgi:hypothetical protein